MTTVGIRALKQNASAVIAEVAAGEQITVTDRGRAVALIVPIPGGRLAQLRAAGLARPARGHLSDLEPAGPLPDGRSLSAALAEQRAAERF